MRLGGTSNHSFRIQYEGCSLVTSTSSPQGELLCSRNDQCIAPTQEQPSFFDQLFSFFTVAEPPPSLQRLSSGEVRGFFGYLNSSIVTMEISFAPLPPFQLGRSDDREGAVQYVVTVEHFILSDVDISVRSSLARDEVVIPSPPKPTATNLVDRYRVVSPHANSRVHVLLNSHFGGQLVVTCRARRVVSQEVLLEEYLVVQAPAGELVLPVMSWNQPWNYSFDESCAKDMTKSTFSTLPLFSMKSFHSSQLVQDWIDCLVDHPSPEEKAHWRLFYHRDLPILRTLKIGDLPLIDLVQKITNSYFYSPSASFRNYGEAERPCLVRMLHSNDFLLCLETVNKEVKKWFSVLPYPSPEAENSLLIRLQALYPRGGPLMSEEGIHITGYSGYRDSETVVLRTQCPNPSVEITIVDLDCSEVLGEQCHEERKIKAFENTKLASVLQYAGYQALGRRREGFVLTFPNSVRPLSSVMANDDPITCGDVGLTWSASVGMLLLSDDLHRDQISIDGFASWNRIYLTTTPSQEKIFAVTVDFHSTNHPPLVISAWSNCKVLWLKLNISSQRGLPIDEQDLFYMEKRLSENNRTLEDCGITAASSVRLELGTFKQHDAAK
eukprot:gene3303-3623_t